MPKYLTEEIQTKIRDLALKYAPAEMCGIIYTDADGTAGYIDVPNTHADPNGHFKIDARVIDKMQQERKAIQAFVHSHPKGSSDASPYDMAQMNVHKKPYVIVGMDGDISVHQPERPPLIGRDYVHGTQDCFGICRDYFARELGIIIPDIERTDRWWEDADAPSLYIENFKAFGFVEVPLSEIRRHDVMLCRWLDTKHVNHAFIYLGDDGNLVSEETPACIGSHLALHHPYGNKSGRVILGDKRFSSCEIVVRHKDLL